MTAPGKPRVGLALGSGSARGWAHIGVIRALEQAGIRPDYVCGTSIGALVGAAYATGELDRFEQWVLGLGVKEVVGFMDVGLGGGLFKGERLMSFFRDQFADRPIEQLAMPFAAVATSLHNGAEIWLRRGSTLDAVRASIAMPGLFAPVLYDGMVLVDGGLVNPVPVSLARAMGADLLIAVDLSSDVLGRHLRRASTPIARGSRRRLDAQAAGQTGAAYASAFAERSDDALRARRAGLQHQHHASADCASRMAGEPPDLTVAPRLAHLRLLDFHRAKEAIEEGRRAVQRVAHNLAEFNHEAP